MLKVAPLELIFATRAEQLQCIDALKYLLFICGENT